MENDQDEVPTASTTVWILLILTAAVSFWCQAVVTEERFVPALNILSTAYNIPDDIAGATLMAAGASSPELFSSIVALFITHSSLGLGTIVGSVSGLVIRYLHSICGNLRACLILCLLFVLSQEIFNQVSIHLCRSPTWSQLSQHHHHHHHNNNAPHHTAGHLCRSRLCQQIRKIGAGSIHCLARSLLLCPGNRIALYSFARHAPCCVRQCRSHFH